MANIPELQALPRVEAARYVLPLREGGSMPGLVEDGEGRLWVAKLRGAGQGPGVLVAELVAGELARALGFAVPTIALLELPPRFGASEGDPEVQDLLAASVGLNVGLGFLSGAVAYDPSGRWPIHGDLAARLVAFDVALSNVDRTHRNPNLLWAREQLWLIDHGAALYWQHGWDGRLPEREPALPRLHEHVALPLARDLPAAACALSAALRPELLRAAMALVPAEWLAAGGVDPEQRRAALVQRLIRRAERLPELLEGPR
jgi:hypothetical protein